MICVAPLNCPILGMTTVCNRVCCIPFLGGLTNAENFKEIIEVQAQKCKALNS